MLKNTITGRFYPIRFHRDPMPGDENSEMQRYRAIDHHATGFDTEAECMGYIEERRRETGAAWCLEASLMSNHPVIPEMTEWFSREFASPSG
jgi:hypothetical protein